MITLERLKEILDSNFTPPFLEEGMVEAQFVEHTKEKTLQVNIGRRDVWISESGEVIAAGESGGGLDGLSKPWARW